MDTTWTSKSIPIHGELHADVKASAGSVTLGTYNDDVQASDLVLTPTQARAIASALNQGADMADAARGAK